MLDIGWSELAIVALIALLVIGPKELPATMRMIAGWIGKIRGLAREFQSGLDDMMRETELDKLKEQAQGVMHGDLDAMVENTIDPDGTVRNELDYGSAYEPFGDFDDPEPEPEPAPKKRKAPAKPKAGAAVAKTTKPKATAKPKSTTAAPAKSRAKPAANASTKAPAKAPAKTAAKTSPKSVAKPAAKSAPTRKPASAGTTETDS
ncbi:MAG TPA: Sec-independent protein translocase protein TatB [Alphaproteobacteria bacterium]|nr:Sec-independent protein translocase protein TatB [Alphaproteobacteria bacterium]